MEFEFDIELDKARLGFMFLGILLGVAFALGATQLTYDGSKKGDRLVNFLENQSGQNLEKVRTESVGKFYKVDVRTSENQLNTYYTDGEMFASSMRNMREVRERNTALTRLNQCLQDSDTVMFGNISQRATQAQIQALGGAQSVAPIYRDVSNNQTLREAVQLGIEQVPAFYQNQSAIQGAQTLQQIQEFTGCDYGLS